MGVTQSNLTLQKLILASVWEEQDRLAAEAVLQTRE